jgi:hypothetical protein
MSAVRRREMDADRRCAAGFAIELIVVLFALTNRS